mgnify:CR=1 FL=1
MGSRRAAPACRTDGGCRAAPAEVVCCSCGTSRVGERSRPHLGDLRCPLLRELVLLNVLTLVPVRVVMDVDSVNPVIIGAQKRALYKFSCVGLYSFRHFRGCCDKP